MKEFCFKHKWLLFVFLGIINAIPFTFGQLCFISWFSLAPFFILILHFYNKGLPGKSLFLYTFLFFFSFHFGIYHFFMALVPMSFIGVGFLPSLLLMLTAWCCLSAFHAITFTVPFFLILKLKLSISCKAIAFSLIFVLVQYVQSLGTYGFTWARISLPQSFLLPLIQSASLFGPYFVDLLLLLTNSLIAIAYFSKKTGLYGSIAVVIFAVNFIYGFIYMQKDFETTGEKTVSIVQGNVLTNEKWGTSSSYSVYMHETLLLENTDSLVVWTETAIPTDLNDSAKIKSELEAYTLMSGNEMLVGAFYCSNVGRELNGAYYVANGEFSDNVYFKRRLVPFGEFLPFRSFLSHVPILSDINLLSADLYPGYSSCVTKTIGGNVGCLICFDSIFSYLARGSVKDGAELLVIMTNDSWYKDFPAVYQHNNQAKWRAVENGRYVVRAANSGVSSFFTPHGETISSLEPLVRSTLTENICFIEDNTLYTLLGDVIICPIAIVLLALILVAFYKTKKLPLISGS